MVYFKEETEYRQKNNTSIVCAGWVNPEKSLSSCLKDKLTLGKDKKKLYNRNILSILKVS